MKWLKSAGAWIWYALAGAGALVLYIAGSRRGMVAEKVAGLKREREGIKSALNDDLAGRDKAVSEAEAAHLRAQQNEEMRKGERDALRKDMEDDPSAAGSVRRLKRARERSRRRRDRT